MANTENNSEQESGPNQDSRLESRQKKTDSKRQQALLRIGLLLGILIIVNIKSSFNGYITGRSQVHYRYITGSHTCDLPVINLQDTC